jgi:UDP-2-acetamido-3-amino-2,3-dideoxy-glucuronate N-acetyltransferase
MNDVFIHPTAIVSSEAIIGSGTKVWVNSQIRERTKVGENCIISKDTYIDHGVTIGDNVKIQNGVSLYSGVTVEDYVFIGPNAVFTNDFYPRAFNEEWVITKTLVKKGASIGANATIICGNELGEYCMVGAGSVVTKNVPKHGLVIGNPAKIIGFVCKCGKKLVDNKCTYCGFELHDR